MKALKYIILLLLILIIGFAIYVAVQPSDYEVNRTRDMEAPAAMIFQNISDFKNWEEWSAWVENDPDLKITYPENTKGVGGNYSWEDKDGVGTMRTIAMNPFEDIQQEMQFGDFEPSSIEWKFKSMDDGKTKVSWTMKSNNVPFMFKAFATMSGGYDNMIGPNFERGLEKLDSILSVQMKVYEVTVNGITEYGGGFYLYKTTNATDSNISQKMADNYGSLTQFVGASGAQMAGMPLTVYQEMNNDDGTFIMSNGIPVTERIDTPADSDILCGYMPKMKTLKTTLLGNYNNLEKAWSQAMTYITENNLEVSDQKPFEIYSNDPGLFPNPAEWKTEIYIPLKEE